MKEPVTRSVFESLAWLHAPADDPGACAIVEARPDWSVPTSAFDGRPSAVWGRMPEIRRAGRGTVRYMVSRERALLAAGRQAGDGLRLWDIERIPPIGRRRRWEAVVRRALMSGALVRLGKGRSRPRVADAVAEIAGHEPARMQLRVSGDGSALAALSGGDGRGRFLRLATIGGLKDARRNAAALELLGAAGVARVPRLAASGEHLGVRWSTESTLPGSPVRTLAPALVDDLIEWSAILPRAESPLPALEERLGSVAEAFPRWAAPIDRALAEARRLEGVLPGVVEHGDLWAGNLLAEDGRLTGVVDWDNAHVAGVPGADLLHLFAMARRSRSRLELGELWLERPWRTDAFVAATRPYWGAFHVPYSEDAGWLAALGWWAAQVSAALRRGRRPAANSEWVARNVDNVAAALADGRA